MSVRVMAAIWDMRDLSPVEKLALLALADWANDDGDAWPSIKQIADKTGCGERTVQRAFRTAETMGILTRVEVTGKGCKYKIHPRHADTPAREAPPPQRHPTPASVAPNTSRHTNVDKPKGSSTKSARDNFPCPDGVDPIDWDSLKANRKAKRAALTEGAHRQIIRKLEKWATDGWPPGPIVATAAERGWTTVFETDEMKERNNEQSGNYSKRRISSDGGRPSGWLS